jgi:hypothetical protein
MRLRLGFTLRSYAMQTPMRAWRDIIDTLVNYLPQGERLFERR